MKVAIYFLNIKLVNQKNKKKKRNGCVNWKMAAPLSKRQLLSEIQRSWTIVGDLPGKGGVFPTSWTSRTSVFWSQNASQRPFEASKRPRTAHPGPILIKNDQKSAKNRVFGPSWGDFPSKTADFEPKTAVFDRQNGLGSGSGKFYTTST